MYSEPWAKFTTPIRPKISDRPMARRTRMPPSTRPVKSCAASADSVMSGTRARSALDVPLLGAGALVPLVGGHLGDGVEVAPVALDLGGRPPLQDPHVLEGLVVTGPPVLLALVVVVGRVGAQGLGHLLAVRGLGEL